MSRKVLIGSLGAGLGHIKQAKAIEKALREKYSDCDVKNIDLLDYSSYLNTLIYRKSYEEMAKKLPSLWRYMYNRGGVIIKKIKTPRAIFDRVSALPFLKILDEYKPDVFIATHLIVGEIISYYKKRKKLKTPLFLVVSDYEAHPVWLVEGTEKYFVSHDEVKLQMIMYGVSSRRIEITGLPVDPIFSRRKDLKTLQDKYKINKEIPTVLLMAGGVGTLPLNDIFDALKFINSEIQIIILCGRDKEIYRKAKALKEKEARVKHVFGYIDFERSFIDELMRISDILISKPGASTISEALTLGLPIVAVNPIPGQEEANADFLLENGVGLIARNREALICKLQLLLKDQNKVREMKESMDRISKPKAAFKIAKEVMLYASRNRTLSCSY